MVHLKSQWSRNGLSSRSEELVDRKLPSLPRHLLLCMLGNFSSVSHRLLTFFKIIFFKNLFQEYYQSVKHSVGPDLGPNCLRRLYQQTAKVTASKERVNGQGMEEDFILVRAPHDKDYGQRSEELVDRQLRVY